MRNAVPSHTPSLIEGLTESLEPVSRRRVSREILILAAVVLVQVAGTAAFLGEAMLAVLQHNLWGTIAKLVMLAGFSFGFAALALRSLDPAAPKQKGFAFAAAAFLAGFGLLTLDRNFGGGMMSVLQPATGIRCTVAAVSFAAPMFIAMTMFMRGAAPVRPRLTAAFIGIAAGSWGVFVYGLQCPFLNVGYIAVWYGGAVAFVTLLASLLLPRVARW
ncbi:MAG: DUF1109 domain-containing protein [Parvularcula sp.]|jgi:hypothetical protein|nr:DUF1109 domain-containing protein [Parvularcula sp.]